jgi:ketosteroid isomerase-like protein
MNPALYFRVFLARADTAMPYAPKYPTFIGSSSPYVLMCSSCGRQPVEARREDTVMETENKEKVRRLYEEGVNEEDLAVVDEVFASDVVVRGPVFGMGEVRGIDAIEAIKTEFAGYHRGEGRITIQEQIAEEESVATRYTLTYTLTAEQKEHWGVTFSRLVNGEIHDYFVVARRLKGRAHN